MDADQQRAAALLTEELGARIIDGLEAVDTQD